MALQHMAQATSAAGSAQKVVPVAPECPKVPATALYGLSPAKHTYIPGLGSRSKVCHLDGANSTADSPGEPKVPK